MTTGGERPPPPPPKVEPPEAPPAEPLVKPAAPAPEVQATLQELDVAEATLTPAAQGKPAQRKQQDEQNRQDQVAKIERTLAQLETQTWTAESDRNVLNLQILLRRKYEGAMSAGEVATKTAATISDQGTSTLRTAVIIALLGWFATVVSVVVHVFLPDTGGSIKDIWPALVATSGAVLLLVGIATLVLRFGQRTHGRARSHYDEAARTRRLEAAIRLLLIGNTKDTTKDLHVFATNLIVDPATPSTPHDDLSPLPEGVVGVLKTAVEKIGEIAKSVLAVAKPKKD